MPIRMAVPLPGPFVWTPGRAPNEPPMLVTLGLLAIVAAVLTKWVLITIGALVVLAIACRLVVYLRATRRTVIRGRKVQPCEPSREDPVTWRS